MPVHDSAKVILYLQPCDTSVDQLSGARREIADEGWRSITLTSDRTQAVIRRPSSIPIASHMTHTHTHTLQSACRHLPEDNICGCQVEKKCDNEAMKCLAALAQSDSTGCYHHQLQ